MRALVVCVRGFHLGYLGCYGNSWISTPALDRLAAQGVVFDQHFADVPDPEAACRAWREGRHPFPVSPPSSFDLLTSLNVAGVATLLIADANRAFPKLFAAEWQESILAEGLEPTLDAARAALDPFFEAPRGLLWLDLAALLPPWHIPPDFLDPYFAGAEDAEDEDPLTPWLDPPQGAIATDDDIDFCRLQATYAGAVSLVDAGLGVLLQDLDERDSDGDTLIIITSDRSLPLGEHGHVGFTHRRMHDELIHLPLLLRLRGAQGIRIDALTQTPDLVPTLLDAFGLPLPATLHGSSLLPLARQEVTAKRAYVCCELHGEKCLRTTDWSYVLPADPGARAALYLKPEDRWEVNDLSQQHWDTAANAERALLAYLEATRQPGPFIAPSLNPPS